MLNSLKRSLRWLLGWVLMNKNACWQIANLSVSFCITKINRKNRFISETSECYEHSRSTLIYLRNTLNRRLHHYRAEIIEVMKVTFLFKWTRTFAKRRKCRKFRKKILSDHLMERWMPFKDRSYLSSLKTRDQQNIIISDSVLYQVHQTHHDHQLINQEWPLQQYILCILFPKPLFFW